MCLACEEADLERRWALIEIISTGRMPAGHTASDLRAMGLPLPGEVEREAQPDGTILIKQVAPSKLAAMPFVCDVPEPAAVLQGKRRGSAMPRRSVSGKRPAKNVRKSERRP